MRLKPLSAARSANRRLRTRKRSGQQSTTSIRRCLWQRRCAWSARHWCEAPHDWRANARAATQRRGGECAQCQRSWSDAKPSPSKLLRSAGASAPFKKRSLSTLEWESRLFSVLSKLVTRHSRSHRTSNITVDKPAIERLKNYLQAHYSENISLSDLSKIAGLSPYHLCRTFSEVVGLPPHRYQTQLRIDRAKKLLLAGRSILYTASQVGFFDQSHFSRHFKRIVGVSPKKYLVLLD